MLIALQVKNLALIEEEEIEFAEGLNILTGETGAGKSIILGALSMALGAKVEKSMLRDESKDAYVEAVFSVEGEDLVGRLAALDVEVFDAEVMLSRRISASRSTAKINGEGVPAKKLRDVGALLLDIYGQQEHVSLLKKGVHLSLLDEYAANLHPGLAEQKAALSGAYRAYRKIEEEYQGSLSDDKEREKELVFLTHEVEEIEAARLAVGEDAALEEDYERLSHSQKIMEACGLAARAVGEEGAADAVGRALREISAVSGYDSALEGIESALSDVDVLLSDVGRELSSYIDNAQYDGERLMQVEERLNTINRLKDMYGATIEEVLAACEERSRRIEKLEDYEHYLQELERRRAEATEQVMSLSEAVSEIRRESARRLCSEVKAELADLNFLDVEFDMSFEQGDIGANGFDEAELVIAMNPGSPLRPLKDIASGGELSRIMLAIKTVLARGDAIDTLIFDEIDTGISGRTAQAVAEKLRKVGNAHQVICITHLPQIAAQADRHFRIEKHLESDATISSIHPLDEEGSVEELARMLGGARITEAVRNNAREMREAAQKK
ncbi:MAG: DNA repair protein RecN [Lachnospiraceae bacterium]|nr:DNA repair protein RecN [Lachnospiraceae bacterium]